MAYGIHDLELTGLHVKTILSVQISHKMGEHGKLVLTADLGETRMDIPVQEAESFQRITLSGQNDGKKKLIFAGIITKLKAKAMGKSCHLEVTAKTFSYLMDIRKKSRSFQDTSMGLGTLTNKIIGEYPEASCQILFEDAPLGEIAVQYQETDWEFLKRMLSSRHVLITGSEVNDRLCIYAGAARIPVQAENIEVEQVFKDLDQLVYWKDCGAKVMDADFIIYRVRISNHVPLYSEITFNGKDLLVSELEYVTEGNVLYETITLRSKEGMLEKSIYPMQLVGSALEGTVMDVKGESVRVHLKIDDLSPGSDCYWFPFSTPSASSDGSGWYCMPEKGDQVRVYFPSKNTGEVIAISAVSTYRMPEAAGRAAGGETERPVDGSAAVSGGLGSNGSTSSAPGAAGPAPGKETAGGKDRMGDPATKYLRTIDGQEIQLTPGGIIITCSGGTVKIEILKSGSINLYAQDYIECSIQKNIIMSAKSGVVLQSPKTGRLKSDMGGSLYLDKKGNINIQGTQVHLN